MPAPVDVRKKPAAVKIHVSNGAGVDITWADGHNSHYDFAFLREECPCATCNDERVRKESFASAGPASSAAAVLPMFKPKPSATAIPRESTATTICARSALAPIARANFVRKAPLVISAHPKVRPSKMNIV
jgi:hypothetical protein